MSMLIIVTFTKIRKFTKILKSIVTYKGKTNNKGKYYAKIMHSLG